MINAINGITSKQAIAGTTRVTNPVTFGRGATQAYQNQLRGYQKGEKLDINCCGTREYSVNGQKINYLA